ncbi:hypothetical protein BSKO_05076 [Bryopsis sp. KO-2023]|nr:hypothetical protein BSKO_05076 [Bryopsis sp. KO-2023]
MRKLISALLWICLAHTAHVDARELSQFDLSSFDINALAALSSQSDLFQAPAQNPLATGTGIVPQDWSPLHIMTAQGNEAGVKDLLQVGALVDVTTNEGVTALHIASQSDFASIAKTLLEAGADVEAVAFGGVITPLLLASSNNFPDTVAVLLENGADPNGKTPIGNAPLLVAPLKDGVEVAKMLVDAGAELDKTGALGFTPLHEAAAYGAEDTTRFLLEKGADASAKDDLDRVPADVVCVCKTFLDGALQPCTPGTCTPQNKRTVESIFEEEEPSSEEFEIADIPQEEEEEDPKTELSPKERLKKRLEQVKAKRKKEKGGG